MLGLNVLIVGGGISGLSCAIALCKTGHTVHIVEIDEAWRTSPTGITLQAHAYRALGELNVAHEVAEQGFTGPGSRVMRADGSLIGVLLGKPLAPGLPVAGGVMRPVLQDILARRARSLGSRISLGVTFSRCTPQVNGVQVDFTDGTAGVYDVMVGADGVFSHVRSLIFPDAAEPAFTGQGSFRQVAPRPPEIDMMTMYLGNAVKAGVTPASDETLFFWMLTPEPDDSYLPPERQTARLKEMLQGFGGVIGELRDSLGPETDLIYRPLKALILPKPWHSGRTILIGDASHATTPHLSSGASTGIEDGVLLAAYLTDASSVEDALKGFTERRFERCRFVVETSLEIGKLEVANAPTSEQEKLYADGLAVLASAA